MAKSHRSTSISFPRQLNKAQQKPREKYVSSLYEIFDQDAEDPKGWILTMAESIARDAGIDLLSFIPQALYAFMTEHCSDFLADPQKYRVPTEEEDEASAVIHSEIRYLDPDVP